MTDNPTRSRMDGNKGPRESLQKKDIRSAYDALYELRRGLRAIGEPI